MSDPHLGDISPGQALDDEKMLLDQPDLETTQRVFKRTLRTLGEFVRTHGKPSVVVVSGDLTYRSCDSGFTAFITLLADYADILPDDPSMIVAVPGNHDVVWELPAGDPRRYEGFLRATRGQGCATPLLDGVDFAADDDDGTLLAGAGDLPHLVVDGSDMLVIPIKLEQLLRHFGRPPRRMDRGRMGRRPHTVGGRKGRSFAAARPTAPPRHIPCLASASRRTRATV